LLLSILLPDDYILASSVFVTLAMVLAVLFMHLMFVSDAVEKTHEDDSAADEVETEKLLEDEDHGRLKD